MYFKIIALLFALHAYCEASKHPLDSCKIKVEPLGCYHDKSNDRAMTNEFYDTKEITKEMKGSAVIAKISQLPLVWSLWITLFLVIAKSKIGLSGATTTTTIQFSNEGACGILNARQADRSVYAGYMISWRDWTKYLPKFICQCAEIAYAKGYRTMGIQFYGECWGSMRGHLDYKKHGKAETCVHGEKREAWGRCTKGVDVACTGEALTNFVYRIAPTACDTYYEPGGCFKDNQNKPRPLPDYLMNERDYSTDNWNGHLINWRNWNTYSPQMICRCAQKAKEMGKKTFSIQFYGECWTGDESKLAVARDGVSQKCLAEDYLACPYNSYHCVGQDHANRVYHIKQTPPTARPWKNPKGPAILFGKKK